MGDDQPLPGKQTVEAQPDDVVILETPGGGGVGDPRSRDPDRVAEDVREGLVSVQQAREVYRVGFEVNMEVDRDETVRLRGKG